MNTILSRTYAFAHTKVGRSSFVLASVALIGVSLSNAHKVSSGQIDDITALFSGGNSFALFILGMGMMIFQASEYTSGSMPYILMRVPNKNKVAKASLGTSAVISIGYAVIANTFVMVVSIAYLSISGTLGETSYDPFAILLAILGTTISYLMVGIIAFATGDIIQSTAGGVFIYLFIYWVLPLSGALATAINGNVGNALVQYSVAANIENLLTVDGIKFAVSALITSAWAVGVSIIGATRFRRYSPR